MFPWLKGRGFYPGDTAGQVYSRPFLFTWHQPACSPPVYLYVLRCTVEVLLSLVGGAVVSVFEGIGGQASKEVAGAMQHC